MELKRPQFKSPIFKKSANIPPKVGPPPEIFGQPNLQDINHPCHMISIIMTSGFEKALVTDFMPIQLIDKSTVIQPRNL